MPTTNQGPLGRHSQNHQNSADCRSRQRLESLAAMLTEAVYPVALRHVDGASWIDLELAVWSVLSETLDGRAVAQLHTTNGK
jgi:hypothetical protein